jgi:hypothetical protein
MRDVSPVPDDAAPSGPTVVPVGVRSCLLPVELEKVAYGTYSGDNGLKSTDASVSQISIINTYPMPLALAPYTEFYNAQGFGLLLSKEEIDSGEVPYQTQTIAAKAQGQPFVIGQLMLLRTVTTGSLVAAFKVPDPNIVTLDATGNPIVRVMTDDNLDANELSAPFDSVKDQRLPVGTPRVFVGIGFLPPGRNQKQAKLCIYHDQYWRPSTSSFQMAPFERKKIILVQQSGISSTSTDESQTEEAISAGVSMGWGPISASINASFSASQRSSVSRSLSTLNESTTQVSIDNCRNKSTLIIYWELVDAYTLHKMKTDASGKPDKIAAVVESIQAPTLPQVYPPFLDGEGSCAPTDGDASA